MSRAVVLMYHAFGSRTDEQDPWRLFVPVDAFERQLAHLRSRRVHFLDLDGYLAGLGAGSWPARSVLITIDDGYVSTLTDAAPALARHGIPSVLFALGGAVGGRSSWMGEMPDEPLLDADGLRALPGLGMDVQVHGWDHTLLPGLPVEELQRQVVDARTALADVLGYRPRAFAYASGAHDIAARAAVQAAGYDVGFAVHDAVDRFAVRRTDVNPTDTDRTFRMKAKPWWSAVYATVGQLGPVRRALHGLAGSARR